MKFRQSLFWDTDPKHIDIQKNASYIIERMLNFGDEKDIAWMWKTYDKNSIKRVFNQSRSLLSSTKNLWAHIFNQLN
ncbi:MAG: hypothetical protein Q8P72_05315 [Candidatus Roizmanbacteria bacterium]|uniref:DUF6922 domain-containing protein n=1 Tax=Candidatus Roizmanbacteria bacterium CG_4_9_14_0_2_um_filter_39_13 TaxID=1974839 RepID=A0A2M8EW49_9BACT|nr:hypothetical protein [Candidatus Roizmanbacteria bacterium]PIZ65754.1 MAG: hypothetical protein COY15_02545 [Candidatus Roizmanbacteria bacterium CG_4_10_14_0_2_um_filter_39_12]PJC30095.1 MAG: hypothetical protein CO051_07400 [Candidatus Roizmanbacteria bacterium CG_4_9_14_0_2_um_filter_39_13]